jgi:hypothetical protein
MKHRVQFLFPSQRIELLDLYILVWKYCIEQVGKQGSQGITTVNAKKLGYKNNSLDCSDSSASPYASSFFSSTPRTKLSLEVSNRPQNGPSRAGPVAQWSFSLESGPLDQADRAGELKRYLSHLGPDWATSPTGPVRPGPFRGLVSNTVMNTCIVQRKTVVPNLKVEFNYWGPFQIFNYSITEFRYSIIQVLSSNIQLLSLDIQTGT